MLNNLTSKVKAYYKSTFIRYGIMAVIVVGIEIGSFWIINTSLGINYLAATVLSLFIGIVLNWLGSRYFVFGNSEHSAKKEFSLVLITSLFGVVLQTVTVYVAVELINQAPIVGKVLAIVVTFFWNYAIRKQYIYKKHDI